MLQFFIMTNNIKLAQPTKLRGKEFVHETNDCTVYTFKQAFRLTYKQAHDLLKIAGRKDRKGFDIFELLRRMSDGVVINGRTVTKEVKTHNTGYRIEQFLKDYPQGTWVVQVREHVFCVKDAVVYDLWDSLEKNYSISSAFKIEKI